MTLAVMYIYFFVLNVLKISAIRPFFFILTQNISLLDIHFPV